MTNTKELISHSADETHSIGFQLGQNAQAGDVILMTGELGAGKTTLTQGIAQGLGVTERPRSPTFVMATEYHGRLPLYHLDLYRIDHAAELGELGLEEYLSGEGVSVVEWADRASDAFSPSSLWLSLESIDENTRRITLTATGDRYTTLLAGLNNRFSTVENR
jgi:tRNA threonylcarbamoyladenosine biosynthesis protein TsaE